MRLGELLRNVGVAVATVGLGVGLATVVGGCTMSQERGTEPAASEWVQAGAQVQLPSLDLEAPRDFQTASFAFG